MYKHVETVQLSATATSITFTNLPADCSGLYFRINGRATAASGAEMVDIAINGSQLNFNFNRLYANNASVISDAGSGVGIIPAAHATANGFGLSEFTILDHKSTTVSKPFFWDGIMANKADTSGVFYMRGSGMWDNSSTAINSITFDAALGSLAAQTAISMYKIVPETSGAVTVS